MTYDIHKNFAITTVLTAPTPPTSGTTLTVQDATVFPAVPFNATVWPLGANAIGTNAEIVRVTNIASNTLTFIRSQEASTARTILVTDQIAATITAKTFTDIETTVPLGTVDNSICAGRLTLTTLLPVTTADVTAATIVYFTPYRGNKISLLADSVWKICTLVEINIAVPATTSTMYDVFIYDSATALLGGTPQLELASWTNDTTRATALVLQDGVLVKSGSTTRRYLGSFRTTTASGQTEDSFAKRYLWNYYNRVRRNGRATEPTDNWNYTTATWRQAFANTANQLDFVVGVAEVSVHAEAIGICINAAGPGVEVGIGQDVTNATVANLIGIAGTGFAAGQLFQIRAVIDIYPAVGRHFYAWLERSFAVGTTTWYGDNADNTLAQSGIFGWIEG